MTTYYNELDPYAAQWLRNLIAAGHIAPGDVDERSIVDVRPDDLAGYTQCHFFAGIGGWSYALRLSGWNDDEPCWTGSCPCQPLSVAGLGKGHADARHLWPAFQRLIAECDPPIVFGEQVASKDGREWLAAVRADMEVLGYAIGSADLCAAGVGAPHIRQRLYWLAYSELSASTRQRRDGGEILPDEEAMGPSRRSGPISNANGTRLSVPRQKSSGKNGIESGRVPASGNWWSVEPEMGRMAHGVSGRVGQLRALGNAIVPQVAAEFIGAFMDLRP